MHPFRYTMLVAINFGLQIALAITFLDMDLSARRPLPLVVMGAFLCLQLPIGWVVHVGGSSGWILINGVLWGAMWEAIFCRYWPRPKGKPEFDEDDLPPDSPFRNFPPSNGL